MAYTKQTWADLPSKTTPINANRLTHIEDGIFNAAQTADTAASTAGTAAANVGIVAGRVETLTGRVNGLDTAVGNKVDKVADKGLSTNDYDNTDKGKVDSLGTASTKNSTSVVTQSTDLVESGAVYDAVKAQEQLIEDTVGWTGKNCLPNEGTSTAPFDVTFTVNSDGTVTANGTSTAPQGAASQIGILNRALPLPVGKYKLSGMPSGLTGTNTYIRVLYQNNTAILANLGVDDSEVEFTVAEGDIISRVSISIARGVTANNVVFKPMIRRADIIDSTYEPYHESVSDSLAEKADNSVIGTVEDGATASKAWSVGEHFIRNGAFCTVTQAISSGGTLTENTNYIVGRLSDVIYRKYIKAVTIAAGSQEAINIPGITGYTVVQVTVASNGSGTYAYFDPIIFEDSNFFAQVVVRNRDSVNSRTWDILIGVTYIKSGSIPTQTIS